MARCDTCLEWFHESCVPVPPEVFKKNSVHWNCPHCKLVAIITAAWVYTASNYWIIVAPGSEKAQEISSGRYTCR